VSIADTPIPDFDRPGQWRAMCRAHKYHLQRLAEAGHEITLKLANEVLILDATYPADLGDGWWRIGVISDSLGGTALPRDMRVCWHPATDRVKIDKPKDTPLPYPPGCYGTSDPRPIWYDANFRYTVEDGYRYWLDGVEYTAEQVRQVVGLRVEPRKANWTWERIED